MPVDSLVSLISLNDLQFVIFKPGSMFLMSVACKVHMGSNFLKQPRAEEHCTFHNHKTIVIVCHFRKAFDISVIVKGGLG